MKTTFITMMLALMFGMVAQAQDTDSIYARDLLPAGSKAPDFTLPTIDGEKLKLLNHSACYQVLDFWASWCGDCRKDIPAMKALYEKYNKAVRFIGVSLDDDKEKWMSCVQQNKMKWNHVSELKKWKETEISQLYRIKWLPTMYLIDPYGKVVLATTQVEKLAAKLEELEAKGEFAIKLPEFTGGINVLTMFLSKNIKYPSEAEKYGFTAKVKLIFVVDADGNISEEKIYKCTMNEPQTKRYEKLATAEKAQLRSHCQSLFCEEALRVIRLMPAWNPGSIGGRPARVKFTQSITFKL